MIIMVVEVVDAVQITLSRPVAWVVVVVGMNGFGEVVPDVLLSLVEVIRHLCVT